VFWEGSSPLLSRFGAAGTAAAGLGASACPEAQLRRLGLLLRLMAMRRGSSLIVVLVVLVFPAGAAAFGPVSSFGGFGSGVGQLDEPGSLAIGAEGAAYVADSKNNRVDVFSPQGDFLRAFGEGVVDGAEALQVCTTATACLPGKASFASGGMNGPEDVAFGPDGQLYVADRNNSRIEVFTPEGAFLRDFGEGELEEPEGIGFSSAGQLYVADTENDRVAVFMSSGSFVREFGASGEGAGELEGPHDVAESAGGLVAVSDDENNRIDVFTSAGAFVRAFGAEVEVGGGDICTTNCKKGDASEASGGLENPSALALDVTGNLYVADTGNDRLAQFTLGGTFVKAFGEGVLDGAEAFQLCGSGAECQAGLPGTIAGATPEPHGVAIDCRGAVYVTEEHEAPDFARVERFGDLAAPPPCTQTEEVVKVTLRKTESIRRLKLRIKLHPKRGTATALVSVAPLGGWLFLHGKGIRSVTRKARPPACHAPRGAKCAYGPFVSLPVRPTAGTTAKLDTSGEAKVRMVLTYKPLTGSPATKRKTFILRKLSAGERR
jgi:NHL repeat